MRIVIDLQGAQTESRFRGIGRYSLSLAKAIVRNAGEHEIYIVLNGVLSEGIPDIKSEFFEELNFLNIRVFDVPIVCTASPWLSHASELVRESFIESLCPDFVLISSMFEGGWANAVTSVGALSGNACVAVILYDLIPYLHKETYLPTKGLQDYYYRKIEWLRKADLLLGISGSSCSEAVEHLFVDHSRVDNISAAIDAQFRPVVFEGQNAKEFLANFSITRKSIMYAPGGFDSRKNFSRLLEAYSLLSPALRGAHQLVIVSKLQPSQKDELLALADFFKLNPGELVLTGYVSDSDLVALYSTAELFVFPSIHEGFGLPVLEAMACGAPVIGSDSTSIPEVIGFPGALFDPLSAKSISQKITEVLLDQELKSRLRQHSLEQVTRFSWDESAKKALAAIERAHAANPRKSCPRSNLISALADLSIATPLDEELENVSRSIAYNEISSNRKQLLLDASTIVHSDAKSGIQRVVRSLALALLNEAPAGYEVRLIYLDGDRYRYANRLSAIFLSDRVAQEDIVVDFFHDDIYLSLDLNMHLASRMQPLHERMRRLGVSINYIVYDLLLSLRPDWWVPPNHELFIDWLTRVSATADSLICISQSVADELATWLKMNPPVRSDYGPKISSFHLGADIDNSLPSKGLSTGSHVVLNEIVARPSFLMVGTVEPRKGHSQTLQAFERLWTRGADVNLVIVGKPGWLVEALVENLRAHPELGKRLFWLEGISDEYLEKVYARSTCLIAASEGEGFGLPLIEAAQHKLPIIARDLPVFREVAGGHAHYFKGATADELAAAIEQWMDLFQAGKHPASDGMPWLTWKQSAEQLSEVLLNNKRYSHHDAKAIS